MILSIGEILIDELPDGRRVGGAPFNFAYHLKQLGMPVRFFSRVGADPDGRRIRDLLARSGFDLQDLQSDPRAATGRVRVRLDAAGVPTFEVLAAAAYDRLESSARLDAALAAAPRMIYFGSLIQRTAPGRDLLGSLLARRPSGTSAFCDINLRPRCYDADSLRACLEHADILKLNTEELAEVVARLELPPGGDTAETVHRLMGTFHLRQVALTRGARGSSLYRDGRTWHAHPEPLGQDLADTVGAGDAFAAMLAAGLLENRPPEALLRRATRFAAAVCTVAGALPADNDFYRAFRRPTRG
jgi:fructokinase